MPIAAVKLVDGARGGIVAVDGVAGARDAELALVPCMLKQAVQLGFHPPQPLQGHVRVVGAHSKPRVPVGNRTAPHAPLGQRTTARNPGGPGRSCCRVSRRPWVAGGPRSLGLPGC